jgi:transcriptional regulator with XRE-family HTH domain
MRRTVPALRHRVAMTLRTHRQALEVTRGELAARAGLTQKFIAEVERGGKSTIPISIDAVWDICKALRYFGARDLQMTEFFPRFAPDPAPQGRKDRWQIRDWM